MRKQLTLALGLAAVAAIALAIFLLSQGSRGGDAASSTTAQSPANSDRRPADALDAVRTDANPETASASAADANARQVAPALDFASLRAQKEHERFVAEQARATLAATEGTNVAETPPGLVSTAASIDEGVTGEARAWEVKYEGSDAATLRAAFDAMQQFIEWQHSGVFKDNSEALPPQELASMEREAGWLKEKMSSSKGG
jgi:hypothetical protein